MSKGQEGFIPLVVLFSVVAAATIFGGTLLLSTHTSPSSLSSYYQPITEKDLSDIADPILKKHLIIWMNQKQFQVKSTASKKKGYILINIKKDPTTYYRTLENDGVNDISETVTIGNTIYTKDYSDISWWRQKIDTSIPQETNRLNKELSISTDEYIQKINSSEYQQLTKKTCGNHTCFIYEQTNALDPESKRVFQFDDKDYLLRQEEFLFGEFKTTNEYSYSEFDTKEPTPTKEIPEGKSMSELSFGKSFKPTKEDVKRVEKELEDSAKETQVNNHVLDLDQTY